MKITLATIDSAAQIIADMGNHVRFAEQEPRCAKCGTPLGVYYCESRVYAVRCSTCGTVTLTKAGNPHAACERVGIYPRKEDNA